MKPLLTLLFLASLVGCATGQPSAFEGKLYYVTTNWVDQPVQRILVSSNMIGTNPVLVITNMYWETNRVPVPHLEPRESVKAVLQTGGAVATGFGAPWLVPILGLLAALYGGWAKYRNVKSDKRVAKADALNTVLSQAVEIGREIMTLTSAPSVEKKFVEKVKSEQVKAGVKPEATKVSSERVDTGAAKEAAADVLAVPLVSNGH